jgi:hypothetical protein
MLWVIVVLALLVLILLIALLLLLLRSRSDVPGGGGDEPPVIDPADLIPSRLDEQSLPAYLGVRLQGAPSSVDVTALPAGPSSVAGVPSGPLSRVVWVDGGDEALVHLDSLTTKIVGATLVVSVDLETDQTGRAPVTVRFALGDGSDPAGLIAATDEVAGGHPLLVSRWGEAVTAAAWSALVGLGVDHADQRGGVAGHLTIDSGHLVLRARTPVTLQRNGTVSPP